MNRPSLFQSHFDKIPYPVCHVGCAQFERQWPPENKEPLTHPISKSLQWLALWHAPKEHEVWIEEEDIKLNAKWLETFKRKRLGMPRLCHANNPPKHPLLFWNASPSATKWAKLKQLPLAKMSELEIIQKIHNKTWLEENRAHSLLKTCSTQLIYNFDHLEKLREKNPYSKWMIKQPWSAAGLGNCLMDAGKPVPSVIRKWLEKESVLIVQPFLEKEIDFSSLWWISEEKEIHFLGSTQMLIEKKSRYGGCFIQETEQTFRSFPFLWQQHLKETSNLLTKIKNEGYFGYVGFDGLVYREDNQLKQAVIEINARQTLAMHLQSAASCELFYPSKASLGLKEQKIDSRRENLSLLPQNSGSISILLERI